MGVERRIPPSFKFQKARRQSFNRRHVHAADQQVESLKPENSTAASADISLREANWRLESPGKSDEGIEKIFTDPFFENFLQIFLQLAPPSIRSETGRGRKHAPGRFWRSKKACFLPASLIRSRTIDLTGPHLRKVPILTLQKGENRTSSRAGAESDPLTGRLIPRVSVGCRQAVY